MTHAVTRRGGQVRSVFWHLAVAHAARGPPDDLSRSIGPHVIAQCDEFGTHEPIPPARRSLRTRGARGRVASLAAFGRLCRRSHPSYANRVRAMSYGPHFIDVQGLPERTVRVGAPGCRVSR